MPTASPNTGLDLDFVRAQFPPFSDPETRDWAHMENAGGSYVPVQVIERLETFYRRYKVQPYADFLPSAKGGEMMDEAKAAMAALCNAEPDEMILGPSTTQNTYVVSNALRGWLKAGDEVIVTNQDHEANIGAWRRLAEIGCVIKEWQVDPETAELDPADLDGLITERTKLVAVTHCGNVVGSLNDLPTIAEKVHAVGALFMADGVAAAPHLLPDVKAMGVDMYAFSLYKTYGPHLGFFYVKRDHHDKLVNQSHYFKAGHGLAQIDVAGPNHAEVGAAAGVVHYYDTLHRHHFGDEEADLRTRAGKVFDLFARQEESLTAPVIDFLKDRPGVRLFGRKTADRSLRAPTITFAHRDRKSADIVQAMLEWRIGIRHGDFYALRCIEALGLYPEDGVVRISLLHYNTSEEVERLLIGLDRAL
ncbi:MAG: aminotransferase class V-fold PLP-dependent enzyme [Alphaproteobacteria bacterium]|nr:aminotransferase class V-fold PLP-dependent enzyme [Alphaproteobacteria bacterium]